MPRALHNAHHQLPLSLSNCTTCWFNYRDSIQQQRKYQVKSVGAMVDGGESGKIRPWPPSTLALDSGPLQPRNKHEILGNIKQARQPNVWIRHCSYIHISNNSMKLALLDQIKSLIYQHRINAEGKLVNLTIQNYADVRQQRDLPAVFRNGYALRSLEQSVSTSCRLVTKTNIPPFGRVR